MRLPLRADTGCGVKIFDSLETLSLQEILQALPGTGIDSAIVHGGFPELHANPDIDFVAFYNAYLASYLDKADLARDVGIAPSTANQ